MKSQLTDEYPAQLRSFIPVAPGWYIREQNTAGENVYLPVMAWRDCYGDGLLKDGVLVPVIACGIVGKTVAEITGDIMFMPDRYLRPNGDGTFKDRENSDEQ